MRSKRNVEINIPEELVFKILINLPVKSLLRFRCVCRSWYSLISNRKFIDAHLHYTQVAKENNVLLRRYLMDSKREIYSIHADNKEFHEFETWIFPIDIFWRRNVTIIGCVNSLVCLIDRATCYAQMLWNPAIRECFLLPRFATSKNASHIFCFGFGYDASSNDYKVVRIVIHDDSESSVGVFSLRKKTWRTLNYYSDLLDPSVPVHMYNHSCNVGRFVYQFTRIRQPGYKVVSFDLSDEVFTVIECPEFVETDLWVEPNLLNFGDSLALVILPKGEWRYQVWVMTDDGAVKSWMKLFSVGLDGDELLRRQIIGYTIVGFTTKGMMLVVGEGNGLLTCDAEDDLIVKRVPLDREIGWHMESYKESLVLLKEVHNVPLSPLPWQWQLAEEHSELKEH